jgi:hypothetical protein
MSESLRARWRATEPKTARRGVAALRRQRLENRRGRLHEDLGVHVVEPGCGLELLTDGWAG